jgi:hypothetical protein
MPNRHLLRVHFIVAKILDMSGLGLILDHEISERESFLDSDIKPDGSMDLTRALCTIFLTDI